MNEQSLPIIPEPRDPIFQRGEADQNKGQIGRCKLWYLL